MGIGTGPAATTARRLDRRLLIGGIVVALAGWLLLALTVRLDLNGDVAYVLGGLEVRGGGLGAAVGTFVHRPLLYRLVLGTLDSAANLLGLHPDNRFTYELVVRLLADAGVVAAAILLFKGLAPRLDIRQAAAVAIAVGVALVAAPNWDFLQPEWLATVFVVLAVASALIPRRDLVAGFLAGGFAVAAVATKLATAPYAPIALLLIALVDRRRALLATTGALAWGVLWLVSLLLMPTERQWLLDMARLNPASPLQEGLTSGDLHRTLGALLSKAALSPAIVWLPAATVALAATLRGWRGITLAAAVGACVLLAVATMVVQGAFYLYHLALLPVLAAAIGGLVVARWIGLAPRTMAATLILVGLTGISCALLLAQGASWRSAHFALSGRLLLGLGLGAAVTTAALVMRQSASDRRIGPGRWVSAAAVLAVSLVLAPVLGPTEAWALSPKQTSATNRSWVEGSASGQARLGALSRQIGRRTPVLYLAYGTVAYFMGNPTDCPYPSPLFLKTANRNFVRDFASYRDNRACLSATNARWLITEPDWLDPATLPDDVRSLLDTRFDCADGIRAGDVIACPRRS